MTPDKVLVAFATLTRKEIVRINRIWIQTLLPSAITMTLYFLIFGAFIGSQVNDIGGYSYMEFIIPGIIMMSVITNAYMNVSSSFFSAKFIRSVEELIVSPTPNWIIIAGVISGGIYRGVVVGLIVLLVSLFFTAINLFNIWIVLFFIILTSLLFSLGGFINSLYANKFDDISIIPTFVLTPLTYLGGVFYSIDLLPTFWQYLSMANPILYMVNGFRYGFLGISDINVWFAAALLLGATTVLYYIALNMMNKGTGLRS